MRVLLLEAKRPSPASIPFSLLFLFPCVLLNGKTTHASPDARPLAPAWQTVFPDTQVVIPLFGPEGPPWRLDSHDGVYVNLTARVPGDLVSDLMLNQLIGDPYFDDNLWREQSVWLGPQEEEDGQQEKIMRDISRITIDRNKKPKPQPCQKKQRRRWSYSTELDLEDKQNFKSWQLIIESLQMGASIYWNDIFLGNVTDQFLRYSFSLKPEHFNLRGNKGAAKTRHQLSITFDPSIETDGRFMACAGGWDWAPYTQACDAQGRRIFSLGIVKPIYLIAVDQVTITHVVPKIYYQGKSLPRYVFWRR
jgi:hypothetical protein